MRPTDEEIVWAITGLVEIIRKYHGGEQCDHDVGICYCGEYSVVDDADRILVNMKEGV